MSEDQSTTFDESRLPYKVRVDRQIYSSLVEPANIKSTLSLHPQSIVNQSITPSSNDLSGYRYKIQLGAGQLLNNLVMESFDLTLTFQVKTYADAQLYNGLSAAGANTFSDKGGFLKLPVGQPRVFALGATALKSNPLDMITQSLKVAVGKTAKDFQSNFFPSYVDAQLRMVKERELLKTYNYAPMKPDDVKTYHDVNGYGYYVLNDEEFKHTVVPPTVGAITGIALNTALAYVTKSCYTPEGATVREMAFDPLNVLGCTNGGRGAYAFESTFYEDSTSNTALAKKVINGVEYPATGGGAVYYSTDAHTLIEVVKFVGLQTPINNVILKQWNGSERALHNICNMEIERRYQSNMKAIVATCISQTLKPLFAYTTGAEAPAAYHANAIYPLSLADASVSVSISNQSINIKTLTLPSTLRPSPICTIPYCKQRDFSKTREGISWASPQTFISDNQILDKVPEYLLLWIEDYDQNTEWANRSPASRAIITQLAIQLGNMPSNCQSFTQEQLYRMTKENGFENYDWNTHIKGRMVVVPNNEQIKTPQLVGTGAGGTPAVGRNYVSQIPSVASAVLPKKIKRLDPLGSIVCLRFGKDIPLNTEELSNAVACSLSFVVSATATSTSTSTVGTMRCMYFSYERAYIDASGDCRDLNQTFVPANVIDGYKLINRKQDDNMLTVNDRVLMGGSWMTGLKNKLNEFMPKVLPAIKKLIENKDNIKKGFELASKHGFKPATRGLEILNSLGV